MHVYSHVRGKAMPEAPITKMELTRVFTPEIPGRVNVRAGGTYAVLIEVELSPEAEQYLRSLAVNLLSAAEQMTYGTTDLEMFGLAIASRLRHASDPIPPEVLAGTEGSDLLAQEVLNALQGHDPKTWFTRVPKP
jgi:hypothetical protein